MKRSFFNFLVIKMDRAGSHIREFKISALWIFVFFILVLLAGASLYYNKTEKYKLGILKNRYKNTSDQNRKLEEQLDLLRVKLLKAKQNMELLERQKDSVLAIANLLVTEAEPTVAEREEELSVSNLEGLDRQLDRLHELTDYYRTLINRIEKDPSAIGYLPTLRPVHDDAITTALFGKRRDPFTGKILPHQGVDFADKVGTPVHATANGRVVFCGEHQSSRKAFGKTIRIDHGNGFKTMYAHLEDIKTFLNSFVKKGEIIGTLGSSGRCIGPHLHYEILFNNQPVDPLKYIVDK